MTPTEIQVLRDLLDSQLGAVVAKLDALDLRHLDRIDRDCWFGY